MKLRLLSVFLVFNVLFFIIVVPYSQSSESAIMPWRLAGALNAPQWLKLSGHQRTRYESLNGQFRLARSGSDQYFVFRTALIAQAGFQKIEFAAEMIDSRQSEAEIGSFINNGIVNTLELVQGYGAITLEELFAKGDVLRLVLGRHTMDVGSRRLIARNRFRNAINNFTGINALWSAIPGETVRLFYVHPVTRLPLDPRDLLDNEIEFDEEAWEVHFWGLHTSLTNLIPIFTTEFSFFGLHENDSTGLPTRNRNFYTAGFRVYLKPYKGRGDFELESVFQIGKSRASILPQDEKDLDHFAHFQHIELGFTFAWQFSPRLVLQCDYASGDEDPDDDDNNRFDTLYGARRFDFGPTGIYGPFARSNIFSPGIRLSMDLRENVNLMLAHRYYWLASDKDAWITSGLRDRTGNSGSYVGSQPEMRIRWTVLPENLLIEAGAAYLFAGDFMKNAPYNTGEGDAAYGYLQTFIVF